MKQETEPTEFRESRNTHRSRWTLLARDASSLVLLSGGILVLLQPIGEGLLRGQLSFGTIISLPHLLTGFLLITVGWVLRRFMSQPVSSVLHPDALIARTSQQLVGRTDDLTFLLECINTSSLVWLTGESGVGKSALIERALLPHLRANALLSAFVISDLGTDWVNGPCHATVRALHSAAARDPGFITSPEDPAHVISYLSTLRATTGRLPILVFDQFDDYQVRNRAHFIRRGRLISSRALCSNNPYWNGIAELVRDGLLIAVFVSRDDGAAGLESVRFVPPAIYHLGRLRPGLVVPFLDRVTEPDIIASPHAGWTLLRHRLSHDLETDGRVLPIQLCAAVRGLVVLKQLSVRSYQRIGGLAGLEAAYLAHAVAEAAAYSDLDVADVRSILLRLADIEHSAAGSATDTDLMDSIPSNRARPARLSKALEYLSRHQFVRRRIDPISLREVWCLDHDYLAIGIRDLESKAHRHQLTLDTSFQSYQQAATLWRRWNALLAPTLQLRLFAARARGSFRYGTAVSFALISLLRLFVNTPFVLLMCIAVAGHYAYTTSEATKLFSPIGVQSFSPYPLGTDEANALWRIAHAPATMRVAVVEHSISDEATISRFLLRASNVVHATVGLNRAQRTRVLRHVVSKCYSRQWKVHDDLYRPCMSLALALDPDDDRLCSFYVDAVLGAGPGDYLMSPPMTCHNVTVDVARRTASRISDAIRTTEDGRRLFQLTELLASLPREAVEPLTPPLVSNYIARIRTSKSLADRTTFASALQRSEATWGAGQALAVSNLMLDLLALQPPAGSNDGLRYEYGYLQIADAFASTVPRLTPAESAALWPRTLRSRFPTGQTPDPGERALVALAHTLPDDAVPAAYSQLLDAVAVMAPNGIDVRTLATVGPLLARRIPVSPPTAFGARTVAAIRNADSSAKLHVLAAMWAALPHHETPTLPSEICATLGRISHTETMASLAARSDILAVLPINTCTQEASLLVRAAVPSLVQLGGHENQWSAFEAAARVIKNLAPKTDHATASTSVATLMAALPTMVSPIRRSTATACVLAFPVKLRKDQVILLYNYASGDDRIASEIPNRPDADARSPFMLAVRLLSSDQLAAEIRRAVQSLASPHSGFMEVAHARALLQVFLPLVHEADRGGLYHDALIAFKRVSTQMPAPPPLDQKLLTLADCLEALGPVRAMQTDALTAQVLQSFSKTSAPPCAALRILLHSGNLQTLVEVLKWPTCSPKDRYVLLKSASTLAGVPFTTDLGVGQRRSVLPSGRDVDYSDTELNSRGLWLFVDWAESHGLDVGGAPRLNPVVLDAAP